MSFPAQKGVVLDEKPMAKNSELVNRNFRGGRQQQKQNKKNKEDFAYKEQTIINKYCSAASAKGLQRRETIRALPSAMLKGNGNRKRNRVERISLSTHRARPAALPWI